MPSEPDRHLIIDGFNAIYALPDYARLLPASLDLACSRFVDAVRMIHDIDGWAVTVVFDSRNTTVVIEKPGQTPGFSVVFAPADLSADGFVEQLVQLAPHPNNVVVASQDNEIVKVARAAGSIHINHVELMAWVGRCEANGARLLARFRKRSAAVTFGRIDSDALKALSKKLQSRTDSSPGESKRPKRKKNRPPQPRPKPKRRLDTFRENPFDALDDL